MSISLEWVVLPNGIYFRTICKNGVPLPDPTRYLLSYANPDSGSTQTILAYGQWLLPFYVWMDRQGLSLTDITLLDLKRFRSELTVVDTSWPPLLRKGGDSASSTIYHVLSAATRFILWAMGPEDAEPLIRRGTGRRPMRRRALLPNLRREEVISLVQEKRPIKRRKLPKHLTQSQLNICRKWIMDTYSFDQQLQLRNRAIFETMWDGALRKGSLLGLQTKNIDWMERSLLVSFDEKDYLDAWFHKSANHRTAKTGEYLVTVAEQTILWLDRYRQEARPTEAIRLKHGIFFCEHAPYGKDHGYPLGFETLEYLFESMSRSEEEGGTGIHITPHMLRHTWATMAMDDDLPTEVIQHQLGHKSILTTADYSHVAQQKNRQTLDEYRAGHPERYAEEIQ